MATPTGAGRTGTFTTEPPASKAMSAVFAQNWWRKDDRRANVAARPA
jgi:hypothetical protein